MESAKTFAKASVSSALTQKLLQAAIDKAQEINLRIAVAVVDDSGVLKGFLRMDGAALVAVDIAHKKAITAVGFGLRTGEQWYNFIKDDPILLHGAHSIDNFTMLGGGIPIRLEGEIVGAIGVSGGHYQQDTICAEAAMAVLG